jgi:hypothetical protein
MSFRMQLGVAGAVALALLAPPLCVADSASDQQALEELRNTVVNLLQALVDKGLMTHEQAEQLVKRAQDKAATGAAAGAAKSAAAATVEENAVRVPYVPQIVKDEISKQVAEQVQPAIVASVVKEAKDQKWGIPGALPDWLSRVRVFGDLTVRGQADMYAKDNANPYANPSLAQGVLLDFNAINQAGGIGKATYPFLDTTQDRDRLRLRARLGVEADLSPNWTAAIRLSSGSLTDPGSESQTLGTDAQRYTVGIDEAYIRWDSRPPGELAWMSAQAGRVLNPWFAPTELVYARDLTFEGVTSTWRLGFGSEGGSDGSSVYLTAGGFPILEVPLDNPENKSLVGGQIGTNLRWAGGAQHLKFAGSYYDFVHVTGEKNSPDSTLLNFTAPAFIRYGNTYFDISSSTTDPTVNLFALAAHFRLVDLAASYEAAIGKHVFVINAEAVRNIGYHIAEVEALSSQTMPKPENIGYVGEVGFGDPAVAGLGDWRARFGYRYVRRDAVLDAWTDADFHGAGTNAEGYYFWTELGLAKNVWVRARYLSGNEIDGPRYGLDIVQIDLNARF